MTPKKIQEIRKAIAVLSELSEEDWRELCFYNQDHSGIKNISLKIDDALNQFNIKRSLNGYKYLKYALKLLLQNEEEYEQVTKCLYPDVAKKFGVKPQNVEHCIRRVAESSFKKGDKEFLELVFSKEVKNKKIASNKEFIHGIAEYIQCNY